MDFDPTGDHTGGWKEYALLPDYLNSLDAMHEAEKVLVSTGWTEHGMYYDRLRQMCGCEPRMAVRATAAHRAEAFLRTLGLWKD